jgi:GNAT superfamily N-acetyltransferase
MACDGEIHLRHPRSGDAKAIATVHVDSWREAYRGQVPDAYLDRLSVADRTISWQQQLEGTHGPERPFWVAEVGGKVVGFINTGPSRDEDAVMRTGEVYAIYVHPGCWEKGIGSRLLERAVHDLRAHGYEIATLWCLATNAQARGFYERAKWRADGASKRESIGGQEAEEVRYRLALTPR